MVRPASEAMYVAAEEKERSRITSDNCTETTSLNSVIYNQRDVTFSTGKPSTRPFIPAVLELCRCGQLHPERVVSKVIPWEMAAEGLVEPSLKPVVVRQPVYSNRILKGIDL